MKIKEIMTRDVRTITGDTTIADASKLMRDLNVGFLPITGDSTLRGVLTDRDIVVRAVAEGMDPGSAKAGDVASGDVESVREDADVDEVVAMMKEHKIRRLPVTGDGNALVGVVSLGDIAVEASGGVAGRTLEEISTPNRPNR